MTRKKVFILKKWMKDPQNIIALGVTLISVCALFVSIAQTKVMIRQGNLMEVQAKSSVRPILRLTGTRNFDPQTGLLKEFFITISNSGVGPAMIDDVQISYNGIPLENWTDLFYKLEIPDTIPTFVDRKQLNHSIIQAGESYRFLDLSQNQALAQISFEKISSLDFKLLYSSIYSDQFELKNSEDGWKNEAVKDGNYQKYEVSFDN
ncbi:hypothetical protein [Algoriphagus pacificus]|uniref:Uncharacterized protein n=1 Tax=Algoriphagus pacificus TaxID=2811234 RepID=A0ABS3CJA2_9BACT|nr:hypothetical protein [Algoriphagus pacificus]MBN7816241.1 hypothetical protein [Algoriphagus pacificus]